MTVLTLVLCSVCIAGGYAIGAITERRRRLTAVELRHVQGTTGGKIRSVIELRAAFHEGGHAVCAWFNPYVKSIDRITIDDSYVGSGHIAYMSSASNRTAISWYAVVINLGGLAGELEEFGKLRSGPSTSDLLKAKMHAKFIVEGGALTPPWGKTELPSDCFDVARMLKSIKSDSAEARVLNLAFLQARHVLSKNHVLFEQVSVAILRKGVLEGPDIQEVFGKRSFFFR